MSCGCNKKIDNPILMDDMILMNNKNIENFSYEPVKNMCHYTCSSINTTNIMLAILVILLIYLILKK
jgi:hypothetical protein